MSQWLRILLAFPEYTNWFPAHTSGKQFTITTCHPSSRWSKLPLLPLQAPIHMWSTRMHTHTQISNKNKIFEFALYTFYFFVVVLKCWEGNPALGQILFEVSSFGKLGSSLWATDFPTRKPSQNPALWSRSPCETSMSTSSTHPATKKRAAWEVSKPGERAYHGRRSKGARYQDLCWSPVLLWSGSELVNKPPKFFPPRSLPHLNNGCGNVNPAFSKGLLSSPSYVLPVTIGSVSSEMITNPWDNNLTSRYFWLTILEIPVYVGHIPWER